MDKKTNAISYERTSPWLRANAESVLHYELELAQENSDHPGYRPLEIFKWIEDNNAKEVLFRALAKLAPMFPVRAYRGDIAAWTSPPPSGAGTKIFLVVGNTKGNKIRAVGGNYFNRPTPKSFENTSSQAFFSRFDIERHDRDKYRLIAETIEKSIAVLEPGEQFHCEIECERFHTMPLYLVILAENKTFAIATPVVIQGERPTDFSFEFCGELL